MKVVASNEPEGVIAEPIPWESESLHSSIQHDSSWLISFIDILTILLTVFVLLLVYEEHEPVSTSEREPIVAEVDNAPLQPMTTPTPATGELQQLLDSLQQVFAESLTVAVTAEQIQLDIDDRVMFKPASAELTPAGRQALHNIADDLRTLPYHISVEGHTDNTPINTAQFPSNWELSAARATVVTRTLIDNGIAPESLRAVGYGDTRPLVANDSVENRTRNRRVSFVLELPKDNN